MDRYQEAIDHLDAAIKTCTEVMLVVGGDAYGS